MPAVLDFSSLSPYSQSSNTLYNSKYLAYSINVSSPILEYSFFTEYATILFVSFSISIVATGCSNEP